MYVVCLHVLLIIFTVELSYLRKRSNAKNTGGRIWPKREIRTQGLLKRNS